MDSLLAQFFLLAEVTTGLLLTSIALGLLLYLFRDKPKDEFTLDKTPTTLSLRGTWANYVIGTRVVAPQFCFAFDRVIRQEKSPNGGASGAGVFGALGSGGKSPKFNVYYESAWHVLALGPGESLNWIREGGAEVWRGPITPQNTPSGTDVTTPIGVFTIYWGEEDQPINEYLGDRLPFNVRSQWPLLMYVVWKDKRLGTSPRWQQLEYEITVACKTPSLSFSAFLDTTDPDANDDGPNPAAVVHQVTTGSWPHGAGLTRFDLDQMYLEELGLLCEDEHLPINILAKDGETAGSILTSIMDEVGFVLSEKAGKLATIPIRPAEDPPVFPISAMVSPKPESSILQGPSVTDKVVYTYDDRLKNYKPVPIRIADDAEARNFNRRNVVKQSLRVVTDSVTGETVVLRKASESLTNAVEYRLSMLFTARNLVPGQSLEIDTIGRFRVASVTLDSKSPRIDLRVLVDQFGSPGGLRQGRQVLPPPSPVPLSQDTKVLIYELPYSVTQDRIGLAIFRIRSSKRIGGASVFLSTDGSSYREIGRQDLLSRGGMLLEPIEESASTVIPIGPKIQAFNTDIINSADLTADDDAWQGGDQFCIIDDEVFYLRKIEPEGTEYRLIDLIRQRAGTSKKAHLQGASVFVGRIDEVQPLYDPAFLPNRTVYFKVVPDGVAISDCSPITFTFSGKALGPLPVDNISPTRFSPGADWIGTWDYRVRDGNGLAADEPLYGESVPAGTPAVEGTFEVRIYASNGALKRTITGLSAPAYTYTLGDRLADFGGEPTRFVVQVKNVQGARGIYSRSQTVTDSTL